MMVRTANGKWMSEKRDKERSCGTKKQFRDDEAGWQAIKDLQASGKVDPQKKGILVPYTCTYCKQIHIGHRTNLPTNPYIEYLRNNKR